MDLFMDAIYYIETLQKQRQPLLYPFLLTYAIGYVLT